MKSKPNKNNITKPKNIILGIIVLIIIIFAAFGILRLLWTGLVALWAGILNLINTISTLDTVLIIALISGAITIIGLIINSIISVSIKTSEYKNKIKTELRTKMEKPYANFINMLFDLMKMAKTSKPISENEITDRMIDFSKEVTLYGSNKVIKKWAKYRTCANGISPKENLILLENILFAIREDLGMKKNGYE
jgi:hypothetical protein